MSFDGSRRRIDSWSDRKSQRPSLAIIMYSSPYFMLYFLMSGSAMTPSLRRDKSPKARVIARVPPTRFYITKPPFFRIRDTSIASEAL